MSKVLSAVLPVVGAIAGGLIGGPWGAVAGGALGGIGGGIVSGQGVLGDLMGGALGALGGGISGGAFTGLLGGAQAAAGAAGTGALNAMDPIQAISNAMAATGTSTATSAAQALGYSGTNAMLSAVNPGWLTTPAAMQGAMSTMSAGVGQPAMPSMGTFTGTMGANISGASAIPNAGALGAMATKGTLGPISSLMSIGSGLYGMAQSSQMNDLAKQLAQSGGQYSPQYAAMLNQLVSNPSSITSMPGYQAGETAVERSMAAQGYQGSGNMQAAIQQYGNNFYNSQVQQLQGLAQSGAGTTAQAIQAMQAGNQASSAALAAMGYGVKGLGY